MQFLNGADEFLGGDQVAQAQPGHGKQFGKPVQNERPVSKLKDRVFLSFINQAVVDLVGNDPGRHVGDGFHACLGHW